MKNNKHLLTTLALLLTSVSTLFAQDAHFSSMSVFKPELANPAYRFENKILDANIIYGLPNTDYNEESIGEVGINIHSQFHSNMGIGIKGSYSTPSDSRTNMHVGASFNYKLELNENMDLAFGLGAGVIMDKYSNIDNAEDATDGYIEVGVAYRWSNLFIGASMLYPMHETKYGNKKALDAIINARYDFNVANIITISPIVNYLFQNDYMGDSNTNGILSGGAMVSWKRWFDIGVTYDTRDITNVFASIWATDYARIFYNGSIPTSATQQKFNSVKSEIGIRVMF